MFDDEKLVDTIPTITVILIVIIAIMVIIAIYVEYKNPCVEYTYDNSGIVCHNYGDTIRCEKESICVRRKYD